MPSQTYTSLPAQRFAARADITRKLRVAEWLIDGMVMALEIYPGVRRRS